MRSFKEIAEYLQRQSEAFNGVDAIDVRIIFNGFMLDIISILQRKGDHFPVMSFIEALEELKNLKSKDDENQENLQG